MALNITIEKEAEGQLDISEKGKRDGETISLNRRLFIQLLAFTDVTNTDLLIEALQTADLQAVLYADLNDPFGVGLLTFSPEPDYFVEVLRPFLNDDPFRSLTPRPEMTMLGRTYTIGYEADLERVLINRPIERVTNPEWPWAVWYPLRRSGQFEQLAANEQRTILMEHGGIGRAYGEADLAHDVRLACHGLGTEDNDFIAGLVGKELYPLSQVVQRMRKTKQTSLYLEKLGPFFIGKAIWQKKGD
ncbi:MAG: chlorite dismutase family protein [Ardenticatenaceae bacterium]|nr:chlorite dismutase family protein [Ardenticatenaceae bacterium]